MEFIFQSDDNSKTTVSESQLKSTFGLGGEEAEIESAAIVGEQLLLSVKYNSVNFTMPVIIPTWAIHQKGLVQPSNIVGVERV